jgi:hypothetical protein
MLKDPEFKADNIARPEELNEIELGYKQMSEDTEREAEALEWIEACMNDICR